MAWDERRDSFGVSFELSGKRAAASGLRDDFILWREPCAGADDGCELAAGAGGLDVEDGALRDGFHAFPLAVQHDSSYDRQGIRQRQVGAFGDVPADSNRGSSLQSPTINTVGDDCAHRHGKMYFRNAKIFGEFVGAQWVDMGIDPYAQFGKLQIKTQKTRCMGPCSVF